jgi:HEAT repeat protein
MLALADVRDVAVRSSVAGVLGRFARTHRRRIVSTLRKLLFDPNWLVRCEAAESAAHLTDSQLVVRDLTQIVLHDSSWVVRAAAAEALGQHASFRTRVALRRAIEDRNPAVRSYAGSSLGRVGTADDWALVHKKIQRERHAGVRFALLGAAWRLGDSSAADRLLDEGLRLHEEDVWRYLNIIEELTSGPLPSSLDQYAKRLVRVLDAIGSKDDSVTTQIQRVLERLSRLRSRVRR